MSQFIQKAVHRFCNARIIYIIGRSPDLNRPLCPLPTVEADSREIPWPVSHDFAVGFSVLYLLYMIRSRSAEPSAISLEKIGCESRCFPLPSLAMMHRGPCDSTPEGLPLSAGPPAANLVSIGTVLVTGPDGIMISNMFHSTRSTTRPLIRILLKFPVKAELAQRPVWRD